MAKYGHIKCFSDSCSNRSIHQYLTSRTTWNENFLLYLANRVSCFVTLAECLRCRFCERIEWILIERALVIAHSDLNSQLTANQMDLQRPCDRRLYRPRTPFVNVLVICFFKLNKRTMLNFQKNDLKYIMLCLLESWSCIVSICIPSL